MMALGAVHIKKDSIVETVLFITLSDKRDEEIHNSILEQ
jgi:hypothetical protein